MSLLIILSKRVQGFPSLDTCQATLNKYIYNYEFKGKNSNPFNYILLNINS